MDPQLVFLIDCLKVYLNLAPSSLIHPRISDLINWSQLEQLCRIHGVLPLVYQVFVKVGLLDSLPSPVKQVLVTQNQDMVQRSLLLGAETLKLMRQVQTAGIRVLPLKGTLLSSQLYGDMALRQPGDIDLLVDPAASAQALDLMRSTDYQWQVAQHWNLTQQKLYIGQQGEISWMSSQKRLSLDLHFRWSRNPRLFCLAFDQAWRSATELTVNRGNTVRVLCPEHQILYLSVHGAVHQWSRLIWLMDIAMLVKHYQTLNWEALHEFAFRLKVRRAVGQALLLTEKYLGIEIPGVWSNTCQGRSQLWLSTIAAAKIQDTQPRSTVGRFNTPPLAPWRLWQNLYYEMRLKNQLSYRIACVNRLLFSARDWQVLTLPEPLWFLYIFLRPFFYLWRVVKQYV
ncbi:MAG: nucleotidyltransferase family protein [Leptolyngbyaceae cyanobacterium MO_188.B28]|nr:nucleotidyltransferase family protein [Leptolyngbyaceae cyanobacterium MO_188.B28]